MATSFADHLRALPDEALAALLALRPDLISPVPAELSTLAVRAQSRVSVARALDQLDRFTLAVLDAVRLCAQDGTVAVASVLALTGAARPAPEPATVRVALDALRARLLVYGPESALCLVAGVTEACPRYPAGLGRPAAQLDPDAGELCADPAALRRTVLAAAPAARAVLDRLAGGPPLGTVSRTALEDPQTPVGWLAAHHLLVPVRADDTTPAPVATTANGEATVPVELPREVGLLLRRDVGPLGVLQPRPPDLPGPVRPAGTADQAGAGQVMTVVRQAETLLDALAREPAPVLRAGGMGVRDLRRLARTAEVDEPVAAALIEIAAGAGLLGEAEPARTTGRWSGRSAEPAQPRYLPTARYDGWCAEPVATRWAVLVRAWLALPRQPGLVGRRDERGRAYPVLCAELARSTAPRVRAAVLGVLADTPPGTAPDAAAVATALDWRFPRVFGTTAGTGPAAPGESGHTEVIGWVLAEAAALGLTGLGALTGYAGMLLRELAEAAGADTEADPLGRSGGGSRPVSALATLTRLLPEPVDHMLVQADLTVVVPGPPGADLAAELALLAEPESAGGASVYRVTPASVRRALDTGYTAAEIHATFARRSRTPVPQGLTYLIDDVARQHGGLRAGPAAGYLRSDDEALLAQVLADRRLAPLALRRLAPTVLVTGHNPARLLAALREAGYAPVAEDASGATVLGGTGPVRASTATPAVPVRGGWAEPPVRPTPPVRLAAIVARLRHADAATRSVRRAPAALRQDGTGGGVEAHGQALAVLRQAVRDRGRVWVGYVDAHGGTASRLVRPVSMGAGFLRAEDDRTQTLHTFALHRITAAVPDGADQDR